MVHQVRVMMPRLGGRKLYHIISPRLLDMKVGRDRFFDILRTNGLLIKPERSYRTTTDSRHMYRKHRNLMEDVVLQRPEQVWVSDITYIGGRDKHLYLALVTDAYSKRIMGYDVSDSLCVEGSLRALEMAAGNRRYPRQRVIHHSDRGVQYCCTEYQRLLAELGLKVSMTESYDPYANAVAERINGILKQEFGLEQYDIGLETMRQVVGESVEIYNTYRPHLSCGMLTPLQMHRQRKVKIKTYKNKATEASASVA
jgi:transposase InsO family protein